MAPRSRGQVRAGARVRSLYRDLQLRGYNRRFVGTPDSVFVVADTDQVVHAVDAAVAAGRKLAVRSGGHCGNAELYYGGHYKKLQEAKARWDPHQVFNHALSVEAPRPSE